MIAAALDGIDRQLSAPDPLNNLNVYQMTQEERRQNQIQELPGSLAEALRELEKDEVA